MPLPDPVPLTVITGFLGAGKTTYLNQLIRQGLPRDSLIVVNDFGDINIDAELIDYRDDRILRLGNGCICCTLGGTLAEQLAQALRMEQRPGAIYIEASGVAEPARIADIARVSRQLKLNSVVCLVDASQTSLHARNRYTGDVWRAQITASDQLIINRLPAVDTAEYAQVLAALRDLNGWAMRALNDSLPSPSAIARPVPAADHLRPMAAAANENSWCSVSLKYAAAIDATRLEQLLREYADVVLRAKGILDRLDRNGPQVLQLSGRSIRWLAATRAMAGNYLVCIGIRCARFDELTAGLMQLERNQSPPA
ncbi:CobW family GTP-binding protein [Pseudomonas violetae]|jgi:G3E family GTPase|uniref:GTP-binding protein n=1 Tax=Pseudomonas violetae TaxID=2915813 RepID=A0ABT0F2Y7_9PSED|nr:CobW family GTP-binding protein [Pseudomonas violetae]MCK1792027.1 GTP-binding protein [Pseudomonas violetae]